MREKIFLMYAQLISDRKKRKKKKKREEQKSVYLTMHLFPKPKAPSKNVEKS